MSFSVRLAVVALLLVLGNLMLGYFFPFYESWQVFASTIEIGFFYFCLSVLHKMGLRGSVYAVFAILYSILFSSFWLLSIMWSFLPSKWLGGGMEVFCLLLQALLLVLADSMPRARTFSRKKKG